MYKSASVHQWPPSHFLTKQSLKATSYTTSLSIPSLNLAPFSLPTSHFLLTLLTAYLSLPTSNLLLLTPNT